MGDARSCGDFRVIKGYAAVRQASGLTTQNPTSQDSTGIATTCSRLLYDRACLLFARGG